MAITVSCICGLKYKVREDNPGRTFACRRCGNPVAIPEIEHAANPERSDVQQAELDARPEASTGTRGNRPAFDKNSAPKADANRKSNGHGASRSGKRGAL